MPMTGETLNGFGELVDAAIERRAMEVTALHEAGELLSKVIQAAAIVADHLRAEVAVLPKRHVLSDDTGDDPGARLAEAGERLRRITGLLQDADLHARRSGAALRHINVQAGSDESED